MLKYNCCRSSCQVPGVLGFAWGCQSLDLPADCRCALRRAAETPAERLDRRSRHRMMGVARTPLESAPFQEMMPHEYLVPGCQEASQWPVRPSPPQADTARESFPPALLLPPDFRLKPE